MSFAEKMGYLDESVFLYCEEPILASRVKKYGYKELYVREITAYHISWLFQGLEDFKRIVLRNTIAKIFNVVLILTVVKQAGDVAAVLSSTVVNVTLL